MYEEKCKHEVLLSCFSLFPSDFYIPPIYCSNKAKSFMRMVNDYIGHVYQNLHEYQCLCLSRRVHEFMMLLGLLQETKRGSFFV